MTEPKDKKTQEEGLRKFIAAVAKLDLSDAKVNYDHPEFKKALKEHEKFKRFMGWK